MHFLAVNPTKKELSRTFDFPTIKNENDTNLGVLALNDLNVMEQRRNQFKFNDRFYDSLSLKISQSQIEH